MELFTRSRDAGPVKLWNAYPVALDEDGDVRFLETPPKMLSLTWSQAMRNAFSEKKSEILKISRMSDLERESFSLLYDEFSDKILSLVLATPSQRSFQKIDEGKIKIKDPLRKVINEYKNCLN